MKVAMDANWHEEPTDVSVNAVCRLAGVSKPLLYREFGSEDGLARAALAIALRASGEDCDENRATRGPEPGNGDAEPSLLACGEEVMA